MRVQPPATRFGRALISLWLVLACAGAHAQVMTRQGSAVAIDATSSKRFADLALACVHKEYPNKIAHVMSADSDAQPPRKLTPAFYGCYDWHSAVHGHWLLVRLARLEPDVERAAQLRTAVAQNITAENVLQEVRYIEGAGRGSFERPYGLAWLLMLAAELHSASDHDDWLAMRLAILPLEQLAVDRFMTWLPKLSYPIRTGEHSQTAFAFGLIHDYAHITRNEALASALVKKTVQFHGQDEACPLSYEPSGQDFLSPCLAEADLMRRVSVGTEYADWLARFLPGIPSERADAARWLDVATVTDKSDGKLAHLDGLNLSRAWMLKGIASGLPADDPRRDALLAASAAQASAGLAAVTGEDYAGGHWLASFATYLVTDRGL